ncbi:MULTISPECIES: helix-turn-helix transcriptional regulator [Neobacillus]|uniref:helix-turn-helix transcriptional regulator n=1 Tax=Neobacillus TaxID=2675232 RepID=UPI0013D7DFE3|nr:MULTISPECIES: helix-turn-helix transcriptional regulator [Neobacillus]MED3623283.1 helix-turn-helix transcriptional regulator [Neobacillus thermocopriae]MED3714354.1 helix-turn-helix transcriptional regulator [Neobacillus thermocopriae]
MFGVFFGLGKTRSKFGKWVDKKGLTQKEIAEKANVGRTTVSNMCSDPNYRPRIETWVKIQRALRSMGYNVDKDDFFGM